MTRLGPLTFPAKLESRMASLSNETKITIGAAIACVGLAISATWWVGGKLNALDTRLNSLTEQAAGGYTLAAASEQALRMAMENPGLRVPDPRDPAKVITTPARNP